MCNFFYKFIIFCDFLSITFTCSSHGSYSMCLYTLDFSSSERTQVKDS